MIPIPLVAYAGMKIGFDPKPEVHLPVEVISHIVSYLHSSPSGRKSIWSCCLVSRQWYAVAIPVLYESPQLNNSNFDKFAATICPPVNAHVRHVGLALLVKHLDMSPLVYESSKSQTARLLRRTGGALESFVAPATSFSISSLAPLSKCEQLRCLDLSLDIFHPHSSMTLTALLRCICKLQKLNVLCLPRWTFIDRRVYAGSIRWPPALTELQYHGALPSPDDWDTMVLDWPRSLTSLAFDDCTHYEPFVHSASIRRGIFQITSLRITRYTRPRELQYITLHEMLQIFPSLRFLSVPAAVADKARMPVTDNPAERGRLLEELELVANSDDSVGFSTTRLLSFLESRLPNLRQIRLHEPFLEIDEIWADCQDVDVRLKDRARACNAIAAYTVIDPDEAGITIFQD